MNKETKMKKKTTPIKPFTEKALAFFQEQNDQEEFTTPPVQGDYLNYLLGDTMDNSIGGTQMEQSFDELSDDSDWFMD